MSEEKEDWGAAFSHERGGCPESMSQLKEVHDDMKHFCDTHFKKYHSEEENSWNEKTVKEFTKLMYRVTDVAAMLLAVSAGNAPGDDQREDQEFHLGRIVDIFAVFKELPEFLARTPYPYDGGWINTLPDDEKSSKKFVSNLMKDMKEKHKNSKNEGKEDDIDKNT